MTIRRGTATFEKPGLDTYLEIKIERASNPTPIDGVKYLTITIGLYTTDAIRPMTIVPTNTNKPNKMISFSAGSFLYSLKTITNKTKNTKMTAI